MFFFVPLITSKPVFALLRSFQNLDRDGDGFVTEGEFTTGILGEDAEKLSLRSLLETLLDEIRRIFKYFFL